MSGFAPIGYGGGSSGYSTIQVEGTPQTQTSTANFEGNDGGNIAVDSPAFAGVTNVRFTFQVQPTTVTVTGGATTTPSTPFNAPIIAIDVDGTSTPSATLVIPSNIYPYQAWITNTATGDFLIVEDQTATGSVQVPTGETVIVQCDGTTFYQVATSEVFSYYQQIQINGTPQTQETAVNLLNGSNINITGTVASNANQVKIGVQQNIQTVDCTAGGAIAVSANAAFLVLELQNSPGSGAISITITNTQTVYDVEVRNATGYTTQLVLIQDHAATGVGWVQNGGSASFKCDGTNFFLMNGTGKKFTIPVAGTVPSIPYEFCEQFITVSLTSGTATGAFTYTINNLWSSTYGGTYQATIVNTTGFTCTIADAHASGTVSLTTGHTAIVQCNDSTLLFNVVTH